MDVKRRNRRVVIVLILMIFGGTAGFIGWTWLQDTKDQALLVAIQNNDAEAALSALKDGADANCRAYSDSGPVTWRSILARMLGRVSDYDALTALSSHLEPVGCGIDEECDSPENVALTEALVTHGANLNAADKQGDTPLLLAICWNKQATTNLLLKHNPNVNVSNKGYTPLMAAAEREQLETVKSLLEHGADTTAKYNGQTALTIISQDKQDMIALVRIMRAKKHHERSIADTEKKIKRADSVIAILNLAGAK